MIKLQMLFMLNLLFLAVIVVFFLKVKRESRRSKSIQDELVRRYGSSIPHRSFFPVRGASESHWASLWKLFPWNLSGVLFVGESTATLLLVNRKNKGVKRTFRRVAENASWIGRKMFPNGGLSWFSVRGEGQRYFLTAEPGLSVINSESATQLAYRNLLADGAQPTEIPPAEVDFALEKHPLTLFMMGLVLLLVVYGIGDTFLVNDETYVSFHHYLLICLVFVAGFGIFFLAVRSSRVPNSVGAGLCLLLAMVMAANVYPLLLRINQWTDKDGLQSHPYRVLIEEDTFSPLEAGMEQIYFNTKADREFWQSVADEEPYYLNLRKGGLGFYQVNFRSVYDDLRAYDQYKKGKGR